ncbi:hypothetical protein BRADI_1g32437v3 [Brachypodium distachyon]|uniref:Uncharacterized protein n=1 Tax=Brachypodium distachyon TaxID=15368 RepID=A0A0Q3NHZ5_BRADI|nr:hypothetical protein BRADI_1g32437v3 [Brachypodium distachyon]
MGKGLRLLPTKRAKGGVRQPPPLQPISRPTTVFGRKPRKEHALARCLRLPDRIRQGVHSQYGEHRPVSRLRRIRPTGGPVPNQGVLSNVVELDIPDPRPKDKKLTDGLLTQIGSHVEYSDHCQASKRWRPQRFPSH